MSAIEERIVDRNLLKLLRAMLRAGVMEDGAVHASDAGTPQGGVISPCLCNVYLHRLDRQWTERGTGILVRFADDLLVLCHNRRETEDALEALRLILAEMGLQLKPAKTRIVHLKEGGEGLDFLGFHHRRVRGERGYEHLRFLARWPSREAMQRARNRIRELTVRKRGTAAGRRGRAGRQPLPARLGELLPLWESALLSPRSEPTRCSAWLLFMAYRYNRPTRFGWTVVNYHSRNQLGLISLDQLVVTPVPSGTGGSSGADRMPAVKDVGEPCAGEPHARFDVAAGGNQASRQRRAAQAPPADPTKALLKQGFSHQQ